MMTITVESVTAAHLGRVVRLVRDGGHGRQPVPGSAGVCVRVEPYSQLPQYQEEQRVWVNLQHARWS